VFLDCGSVGWLGHESREDLAQFLMSALRDDAAGVCDALLHLGVAPPETDIQALRTDIDGLLARYGGAAKDELRIGDVLRELMRLVFRYEIKLASEMALVLKALILMDSVCLALDPEFNFREAAEPLAHELGPTLRSPKELVDDLVQLAADLRRYMTALPRQISRLLTRAEQGNLKVKVEYDEIDRPLNRLDIIANRLSFSVVVSAIILASALLLQAESPLMVRGFPLPGVIGLGLGSLMGLWLLYSILRSGRM
jgi:ubiquinone biosynthesis protein